MISGYRAMWVMVMFDLPVLTKQERKKALNFRNFLLDEGFEMSQLSVYLKHTHSREKWEAMAKRIIKAVPAAGKVSIVPLTDKQFSQIVSYRNCNAESLKKEPNQYELL